MNTIELVKNIKNLIENDNYVMGHSIFIGRGNPYLISNQILQDGLMIHDSSKGVTFTARYFGNTLEECMADLGNFKSVSSGSIIIICIPKKLLSNYDSNVFSSYDITSILLEETGKLSDYCTDIYGNPTLTSLLPTKYIFGYLDIQRDLFIENPSFILNSKSIEKEINEIKIILDKKYEKVLKNCK